MPRFYFTIRYLSVTEDIGGLDVPNLAAACDEALRAAQAYRTAMSAKGLDPKLCSIEISDQSHRVVQVIPFSLGTKM